LAVKPRPVARSPTRTDTSRQEAQVERQQRIFEVELSPQPHIVSVPAQQDPTSTPSDALETGSLTVEASSIPPLRTVTAQDPSRQWAHDMYTFTGFPWFEIFVCLLAIFVTVFVFPYYFPGPAMRDAIYRYVTPLMIVLLGAWCDQRLKKRIAASAGNGA
jgi:hypothetical protein